MTWKAWNWIVAYLIPGFIYRPWTKYVWSPIRYRHWPWDQSSACDTCPVCQMLDVRDGHR